MKYIFTAVLLLLAVAGFFIVWSRPDSKSDVPVLYWVTDPNPARQVQIDTFHKWLVKNGFTKPGDPARPCMILKVDAANSDATKKIIQGVSGVGGDIMDISSSNGDQLQFYQMGLLADVTEPARTMTNMNGDPIHFDPSKTFPAILPDITVFNESGERRQVMFPCNLGSAQYWVNKGAFEKVGMAPPAKALTVEEFEKMGKEFVRRSNKGKKFPDVFFASTVPNDVFIRSFGLSYMNETLTASRLDDLRYVHALELIYKWTYKDRILPSLADKQSASASAGYGGQDLGMFNEGKFGIFYCGRYALIRFREIQAARKVAGVEPLKLGVIPPVYGEFLNAAIGTRGAVVYIGGRHSDKALLFLSYLASKDYNDCIVADGDSLPPNPEYLKTPEFLEPAKYPLEKGCHEPFAKSAMEFAIAKDYSPFMPPGRMIEAISLYRDKFMNNQCSAARTAADTQNAINVEITRTVSERPYLQGEYSRRCDVQKQIDERMKVWLKIDELEKARKSVPQSLRESAKKIPLDWLYNPFYRKYYQHKGWAE